MGCASQDTAEGKEMNVGRRLPLHRRPPGPGRGPRGASSSAAAARGRGRGRARPRAVPVRAPAAASSASLLRRGRVSVFRDTPAGGAASGRRGRQRLAARRGPCDLGAVPLPVPDQQEPKWWPRTPSPRPGPASCRRRPSPPASPPNPRPARGPQPGRRPRRRVPAAARKAAMEAPRPQRAQPPGLGPRGGRGRGRRRPPGGARAGRGPGGRRRLRRAALPQPPPPLQRREPQAGVARSHPPAPPVAGSRRRQGRPTCAFLIFVVRHLACSPSPRETPVAARGRGVLDPFVPRGGSGAAGRPGLGIPRGEDPRPPLPRRRRGWGRGGSERAPPPRPLLFPPRPSSSREN